MIGRKKAKMKKKAGKSRKTKKIVGLIEKVEVIGEKKVKAIALLDTGAVNSSIDIKLAAKARLGPITCAKIVRKVEGRFIRPAVAGKIKIAGETIKTDFSLSDRNKLFCPVLIGRNIIHDRFVIDPEKSHSEKITNKLKKKVRIGMKEYI